jgi:hypothetical protein
MGSRLAITYGKCRRTFDATSSPAGQSSGGATAGEDESGMIATYEPKR